MLPPLTTISGFAPKLHGFHKTRSASLPIEGGNEPEMRLLKAEMERRRGRTAQSAQHARSQEHAQKCARSLVLS